MPGPKPTVAVITDSLSSAFYFPKWIEYYSKQFGSSNLYVATYTGFQQNFYSLSLGGIWEIPSHYNDAKRAAVITGLVHTLLGAYDYVLRVDTDEFLLPDPRYFASLKQYVEILERPYVTAMGYDIIQDDGDGVLDLSDKILIKQRKHCYPFNALNKTCLTTIPINWLPGFHYCSVFPEFNQLFLLHLKRADIALQSQWSLYMASQVADDPRIKDYYAKDNEKAEAYMKTVRQYPRLSGWANIRRTEFNSRFQAGIKWHPHKGSPNGVYHGEQFSHEKVLVELPPEFSGFF